MSSFCKDTVERLQVLSVNSQLSAEELLFLMKGHKAYQEMIVPRKNRV